MKKRYSISAILKRKYDAQNIKCILEKGKQLGFGYSNYVVGEAPIDVSLNIGDATNIILKGDEYELHRINVKINDTYTNLFFVNEEPGLGVMLYNFSYPWMKKFEDGSEEIDIVKYAKIFLNLIEDYEILELQIDKD